MVFLVLVIAVLLVGFLVYKPASAPSAASTGISNAPGTTPAGAASPKDATYVIDGASVALVNGLSETAAAPGSTSKVTTRYFGNEVVHDVNGDGRPDSIFILTQNTGGSGTFYYVVAALNLPDGYVGSQGFLLGDRIAPETTEMSQDLKTPNVIVVNYADRAPGDSFAVAPSIGKSLLLLLDPKTMQFGQVAQNFEGEANPATILQE